MTRVKYTPIPRRKCKNCKLSATYVADTNDKKIYKCFHHKNIGMRKFVPKCEYCPRTAYFINNYGNVFCSAHKTSNKPKCKRCSENANFGYTFDKMEACIAHRNPQMINRGSPICRLCSASASFAFEDSRPEFCSHHKKYGMICRKHLKCLNCKKNGIFSRVGFKSRFCIDHKTDDMIISKRCKLCLNFVSAGYTLEKLDVCSEHIEPGMIECTQSIIKEIGFYNSITNLIIDSEVI